MVGEIFLQADLDLVAAYIALSPHSRRQIAIKANIATANLARWLRDGTRLSHESVARLGKEIGLVVEPGYVAPYGYYLRFCKGIDIPSLIVQDDTTSMSAWRLISKRLRGFDVVSAKVYKSKSEYSYVYLFYQGRQRMEQPDQMRALRISTDFELPLPSGCHSKEWDPEDFDIISNMQMDRLWSLPRFVPDTHTAPSDTNEISVTGLEASGPSDNGFENQFSAWTSLIIDLHKMGITPDMARKQLSVLAQP